MYDKQIILILTFLILICSSTYGQKIDEVVKYVERNSGYKITNYSTNEFGNYDNKDPKFITDITIEGASISDLGILNTFPKLNFLRLLYCKVGAFFNLPSSVRTLMIDNGQVNSVIIIPSTVERLTFWGNKTDLFPILPNSLIELTICDNEYASTDNLPDSLKILDCSDNRLKELPKLPTRLVTLRCAKNHIKTLPVLPVTLKTLDCSFNEIKELKNLPNGIERLNCGANQITSINKLPKEILELNLIDNPIKKLPKISNNCQLSVLPTFLIKQNDNRYLMLDYKSKCPTDLKSISNGIYKAFVNYDFNTFVSHSININDFSWLSPLTDGDSISKMRELHKFINESIVNQVTKDFFLTIATEIDNDMLLLDSVEVEKIDSTDFSPYKTYKIKFYFKRIGYDNPYRYLSIDIVNSPRGFLWISFFSNLRDVGLNEKKPLQKKPLPDKMPNDFEITTNYGHNYRFNSKQGVFIKGMTCHRAIAKVNLTVKEKSILYCLLKEINFNEYEEDIITVWDSHFPVTSISINYNGVQKTVNYNCLDNCDKNEYQKMKYFIDTLNQILYKKRNVRKLPKATLVYV